MTLQKLLDKHKGNFSAAAREAGIPRSTFKDRFEKDPLSPIPSASPSTSPPPRGIALTDDLIISKTRPASSAKTLILSLPKNRGYTAEELSKDWNLTPTTVLTQARRLKAIRYVIKADGEILRLICHPET